MPRLIRYDDGFEITASGGPDRVALADEVRGARRDVAGVAVRLMGLYLAPGFVPEGFDPVFAEVFEERTPEQGDLSMSFTYSAPDDPHSEGDTRFDVFLTVDDPPRPRFHAIRFAVGFW